MPAIRYPCTMYKPGDLARARENIKRHAWAKKLYGQIRSHPEYYLAMDRDRMRSYIGDQTPLVTVVCPNCGCGPWYAYSLINHGDTLQCTDCKTTWDWDPEDTSETMEYTGGHSHVPPAIHPWWPGKRRHRLRNRR